MNPYEKIKGLAKERKISVRELEKRLGYSNGYFGKWKTVSPNSDGLAKVADYFNVSVDYLLGRTENPSTSTSNDESETELRKALENVMSFDGEKLTENDKDAIIAYMMGRKGKWGVVDCRD